MFHYAALCIFVCLLDETKASWWLLATPAANQMIHTQPSDGIDAQLSSYKDRCAQMTYLVPRQRELCGMAENLLEVVSKGAQMGVAECQQQFKGRHWNCTAMHFDTLQPYLKHGGDDNYKDDSNQKSAVDIHHKRPVAIGPDGKSKKRARLLRKAKLGMLSDAPEAKGASADLGQLFGKALTFRTREQAYMHAVGAAGVAYSITRACTQGSLPSCRCDAHAHLHAKKRVQKKMNSNTWEWGGCSEDILYGQRLSKDFVDATEISNLQSDPASTLMNLHNNEAGRRAVRSSAELVCKCHGVSGSCTAKICWRRLKPFNVVGARLTRMFDEAVKVVHQVAAANKLAPAYDDSRKRPRKRELIYLEESPDYCESNPKYGIMGTKGRQCSTTSYEMDNCDVLCCGRGYTTVVEETKRECNCEFVWCCQVECKTCVDRRETYFCN